MVNLTNFREVILRSINEDGQIELLKQTKNYVHTYDNEDGRYISYRITPYTVNSLSRHIYLGKSMQKKYMRNLKKLTAGELLKLPSETLMTINRIFIVDTEADIYEICEKFGYEEWEIPDKLWGDDEDLAEDSLGVFWFQENSVFINMHAIKVVAEEVCEDRLWDIGKEIMIGFFTTLFHELRHEELDGQPFEFPWLEGADHSEKGVEAWAREWHERLFLY